MVLAQLAVHQDRDFRERNRRADRAGRRQLVVADLRDGARKFGHAVDLPEGIQARYSKKTPLDFTWTGRGANPDESEAGDIRAIDRHAGNRADAGRHHAGRGNAIGLDDLPEILDHRGIAKAGGGGNVDRRAA